MTRDRLYRETNWQGHDFILIDTGGIEFQGSENLFRDKVKQQAEIAIEEAAVIVLVVDGQTGITSDDEDAAQLLRRSGKPVVVAVNKIDNVNQNPAIYDFYALGLGEPIGVSSVQGMNTGDLLDAIVAHFPAYENDDYEPDTIKLAVIGRPNVGKSSLVNKMIGAERVIVSPIAGTTRDAIDTPFVQDEQQYVIIDTAGMRKRGKIYEPTERYSVDRALKAVDRSDIVVMVVDAVDGVTEQDKKVVGYAHEAGKGILVVVNKWDLLTKDEKTMDQFDKTMRQEMPFLEYALTLYVSALSGQRVDKILPLVKFISEQQTMRVTTARLNEVLEEAVLHNPPPTFKGRRVKVLYGTQVGVKPPKFVVFVNIAEGIHFSYERYLVNQIRKSFGFAGTPVWLMIRQNEKEGKA